MRRSLEITELGDPPFLLAAAKLSLRVYHDDDDSEIVELVKEAYGEAEARTGRMVRTCSAIMLMDQFPVDGGPIVLPLPPLTGVTSVQYYDTTNTLQTLNGFQPSTKLVPGLIARPVDLLDWPATKDRIDAVRIAFTAGGAEPEQIRSAVRLLLNLSYNDVEPAKAETLTKRINGLLHGYTLRDPRLAGVTR